MSPKDFDNLDDEMLELERQLQQEMADMPGSDLEQVQRQPHLAYLTIYTSDIEELAEFYVAAFGFDRRYESPSAIELQAGTVILTLAEETQLLEVCGVDRLPHPEESRSAFSILVEDVERCVEAAVAMGGRVVKEPHDTDWGMRSCWLRDPSGQLFEIGRFLHGEQ
jgi:catechol 2,3-dioxygenase-like lactoylglutathione lyase family enzyme